MDNTETDIGDIGHTKRKTKTNKAKQKKQKQTKQNKTIPQHSIKTMCNTDTTNTRDEPRFTASYKTPSVLLI
jgi:hypothetical protein